MRFFILVAAAAGIGAGSIFAFKTMLPGQNASLAAAVRTLSTSAAQFRLSDLNPIRSAYDEVTAKVTSPDPSGFNFRAAPPIVVGEPLKLSDPVDLGAIGGGANFQYRRR